MDENRHYFSYLLRVWLEGDSDPPHWHASLEDTHSNERRGFASLEALWEYLHQQTCLCTRQPDPNDKGRET